MSAEKLYVYGLMRAGQAPTLAAPAVAEPGGTIRTLSLGALSALVSDISLDEVVSTRRNLLAHTRALEEAMAAGPVLPMRFGIIAAGEAQLSRAVLPQAEKLLELLDRLEGRAEYGVRIAWSRDVVMREVVSENPVLAARHEAIRGKPEAATYYERIDLGRDVAEALSMKRTQEEAALFQRMAAIAVDRVLHAPDDDVQALKADLLVDVVREAELQKLLEAIEAERPGRLTVRLVGPAPAYNFVRVRLALEEPEAAAA